METIFISLVSMALIIISSVTMAVSTMQSNDKVAASWKQMETQSIEIMRTSIVAQPSSNYNGGPISITVQNDGQTNLSDFAEWDVIVQYESGGVSYLTYSESSSPGNNGWTVLGIYSSGETPAIFDPGVLDSGEQMILSVKLNPELSSGQSCRITISTPNGVKSQIQVNR